MAEPQAGLGSLYPFLYAGPQDLDAVLAEVRASTVEKAGEIVQLREAVLASCGAEIARCAGTMAGAFRAGGKLLAFGNGGSATDAQALATMFLHPPTGARPLPALSLTNDPAVLTALANDIGYEVVFSRQIAALGRPGDIAFGVSTSGNSRNVLRAFEEAQRLGLRTVGTAGYAGGELSRAATVEHMFVVPSASVHRIQEAQTTVYDVLWELIQLVLAADAPAPS